MKNVLTGLCLIATVWGTTAEAQTLFTFGKHQVSKEEFLQAFRKNNDGRKEDEAAYRNYLDLYIRYKLKVQAAYDRRADTLPSQRMELENFREQVAKNYLYDQATLDMLVKEAEENSKRDIRISHIYIPVSKTDTLESYKRAVSALEQLKNGKSFEAVAEEFSLDPAVKMNKGDIGWIGSFTLPYPLEKLAYTTALNQVSGLYRGPNAYHIFKPTASRPAAGLIQVAQILLALPTTTEPVHTDSVGRLADSLYRALLQGADFGRLAMAFSADNNSYQKNGILPPFHPGTYTPEFEDQAFALKQDAPYSKPFRTAQGFHILRLLPRQEMFVDQATNEVVNGMAEKVKADERGQLAHEVVIEKVKKLTGFQTLSFDPDAIGADTKLALINGNTITGKEYLGYAKTSAESPEQFLKMKLLEEYQQNLEQYEPAFAAQLKEFAEGNLLFEMMQQMVWEKAGTDEEGLKNFYQKNRNRYLWKDNVRAVIFTGPDSLSMHRFHLSLVQNPGGWKALSEGLNDRIQADSGRFELEQLPVASTTYLEKGMITKPGRLTNDLGYVCLYILEKLPGGDNRSFEEARGFVLNDYQETLENDWIATLRKKYPVTVNKSVLKSLNR